MEIYPSLISADLLNLETTIRALDPFCAGFHIDVMDFHFVPNLTWGPQFVCAMANITKKPLYVHLMVDNPLKWVEVLPLRNHDFFVFHFEAVTHNDILQLNQLVHSKGNNVGIAINPGTSVSNVFPYLFDLDTVLLMSVNPGFSGQSFIPSVMNKIVPLKEERDKKQASCIIAMDGGINAENIEKIAHAGVDSVAIASALFEEPNPCLAIENLQKLCA